MAPKILNNNLLLLDKSQQYQEEVINSIALGLTALNRSLISTTLTTPPSNPANESLYLVATGATGNWTGKDGKIAQYYDGQLSFYTPYNGLIIWAQDLQQWATYNNGWQFISGGGGSSNSSKFLGYLIGAPNTYINSVNNWTMYADYVTDAAKTLGFTGGGYDNNNNLIPFCPYSSNNPPYNNGSWSAVPQASAIYSECYFIAIQAGYFNYFQSDNSISGSGVNPGDIVTCISYDNGDSYDWIVESGAALYLDNYLSNLYSNNGTVTTYNNNNNNILELNFSNPHKTAVIYTQPSATTQVTIAQAGQQPYSNSEGIYYILIPSQSSNANPMNLSWANYFRWPSSNPNSNTPPVFMQNLSYMLTIIASNGNYFCQPPVSYKPTSVGNL